ncbi:hypothetical protein CDCA_CDCA03G1068 [Cyanidium caldarium]|uniref:SKI-interacting protein SKIP SNW domain-containing protein n=1 Tax=Cyanidium caldarium TaxID=2771 RepID=A0AAV9ISJ6_CYACA|nr:hypothetical protein CDCA_CDCA03G1068 [Cyanidium caldarium]|eukprot:ctg_351.g174
MVTHPPQPETRLVPAHTDAERRRPTENVEFETAARTVDALAQALAEKRRRSRTTSKHEQRRPFPTAAWARYRQEQEAYRRRQEVHEKRSEPVTRPGPPQLSTWREADPLRAPRRFSQRAREAPDDDDDACRSSVVVSTAPEGGGATSAKELRRWQIPPVVSNWKTKSRRLVSLEERAAAARPDTAALADTSHALRFQRLSARLDDAMQQLEEEPPSGRELRRRRWDCGPGEGEMPRRE